MGLFCRLSVQSQVLLTPRRHGPKCQPHHQERINREDYAALYNCLGHFKIYVQCVFYVNVDENVVSDCICLEFHSFYILKLVVNIDLQQLVDQQKM